MASALAIAELPLAAVGDWLQFLIPLVFFVIYAINHLISGGKNKPQPPPPRNPPRRKVEAERPLNPQATPPPKPVKSGQAQLNAEIEQFLKRAEQRRGERPRREQPPSRPAEPPQPRPPLEPSISSDPMPRRELSTVASSVEEHLGNRGFGQRAEHLADDITRADQQMEAHLQKAFSHRVGTLGTSAPGSGMNPVTDAPATVAVEETGASLLLAGLLSSPQQLKQAILMREILDRPEHRW